MAAQTTEMPVSKVGVDSELTEAPPITNSKSVDIEGSSNSNKMKGNGGHPQPHTIVMSSNSSLHSETVDHRSTSRMKRSARIDHFRGRYPHSIVWTPITVISWFVPLFGHTGIAYTNGKIRDFADSFVVSDDRMTYGRPTKYWMLDTHLAEDGQEGWDNGVDIASEEYTVHDHDTLCDNSFSMVALALNLMRYKGSKSWNVFWVFLYILIYSKYVGCGAFWKTWGPFLVLVLVGSVLALPFLFGNAQATLQSRNNTSTFNRSLPGYLAKSSEIEIEIT